MPDAERTWIKVATADGNEGFAIAHDLLTPSQFEKRKKLLAQKEDLSKVFERAKKSWGPLGQTAGVWTFGKHCIQAIVPSALSLALYSRWIWWTEGNTQYRVNMLFPDKKYAWHFTRKNTVNLNRSGRVRLYRFTSPESKDVDLMGFKGDEAFFHKTGTTYGIASRCGTIAGQEYESMNLWSRWVETAQRQPDKK
jgi:hypothetical protein